MNLNNLVHEMAMKDVLFVLSRRGFGRASILSLFNTILNRVEKVWGCSYLLSNPDSVQIEPTTTCNLHCTMCGRMTAWHTLVENPAFITRETFLKVVPFLRSARQVFLHGWGESLLHPDISWMVETCKQQGCVVNLLTNGLLLDDKTVSSLMAAGLDTLNISIDAATAETYKSIRGGRFAVLLENLERVSSDKIRQATRFPILQFTYCLMKRNLYELSTLVDIAHKFQVDAIYLQNLIVYNPSLINEPVFDLREEVNKVYAEAKAKAERLGILLEYNGVDRTDVIPNCAYTSFTVLCDGSVGCCGAQRVLVGNIHDKGLREIWNGTEFQEMRRQYERGVFPLQCERCPNKTNAEEDHVHPDMSYVSDTLHRRRWELASRKTKPLANNKG